MSKEQDELDKLKSEGKKLEAEIAANEDIIKGLDPEKDKDKYHSVAQELKQKGDAHGKNKDAVSNQLSEVEAAKKAALEKKATEAGEQTKAQVLEAKDANPKDPTQSFVQNRQELQGQHSNIYHSGGQNDTPKVNNGLTDIKTAQQKAQEQAKGELEGKDITVEQGKEQQEQDRDDR